MRSRLARMEQSAKALALIKLGNVGLSMLWGFAITYVFVRVLPHIDFVSFLLLVAISNLTVSAEFGLTNIIYARLRQFWLGESAGTSDFRQEELGALFLAMLVLVGGSALGVTVAMLVGLVPTGMPVLFLLFFLANALNIQALLAKRALAAVDCNLVWEGIDLARRSIMLGALLSVLVGFSLIGSVVVQVVVSVIAIGAGLAIFHRKMGMKAHHWTAWRAGGGHMRRHYLRDIGASVLVTSCEIIAYNAPYFTIAVLSDHARLLLLFDFVFKMLRAVSTAIRATIEAVLPRVSVSYFALDAASCARSIRKAGAIALALAACAAVLLLAIGQKLFAILFDDKAVLQMNEIGLIILTLFALSIICTSVYVQVALGRYREMLRQSVPFVLGALCLVPLAVWMAGPGDAIRLGSVFMVLYAALFFGVAALHVFSLKRMIGQMKLRSGQAA